MGKRLKVGVIGVGGIARAHFPGWQAGPHAEIAALADASPTILQRVGDELGVSRRYQDARDLMDDPDIDIVDICVPNAFHAPLTIAALEAGKHVLCEKPLAITPDEVRRMIAAQGRSGKLLMTAQHFRFEGSAEALKAEIDGGVLGEVYHARAWWLRRIGAGVTPGFIQKRLSGGGALLDIGVHMLDLALWMMDHPKAVTVSGITHDRLAHQPGAFNGGGVLIPNDFEVEEFGGALVRFENGATLMLETSWMLHHLSEGSGEEQRIWLYGDKGGACWPDNEIVTTNNATKQLLNTRLQLGHDQAPHARECMAFAEAIAEGRRSPVPAEQSLGVIAILDGIYRSAASGREVNLEY